MMGAAAGGQSGRIHIPARVHGATPTRVGSASRVARASLLKRLAWASSPKALAGQMPTRERQLPVRNIKKAVKLWQARLKASEEDQRAYVLAMPDGQRLDCLLKLQQENAERIRTMQAEWLSGHLAVV